MVEYNYSELHCGTLSRITRQHVSFHGKVYRKIGVIFSPHSKDHHVTAKYALDTPSARNIICVEYLHYFLHFAERKYQILSVFQVDALFSKG